ncbi:MAG: hypothetical protein ACOCUS_04315 [Polyangiales bacterium]
MVRNAEEGGLIPRFDVLAGPRFDASRVHPEVRSFYEDTARYRMDVWAKTSFPASVAPWLLVTTISRKVDQLNFPVDTFDTVAGMDSEIVLLKRPDGTVRYTGWFRRLAGERGGAPRRPVRARRARLRDARRRAAPGSRQHRGARAEGPREHRPR